MMKKSWVWLGLMALVLCLSVSLTTGCAKKAALKQEAAVTQKQKPVTKAPAVKDDQAAARQRAAREQAMRERAMKEKAAREAAERAAKEAAEKAAREAAAKKAAMLKELKIADIHFDFDKYNLKPEAQEILKKSAPAYLKYRDFKLGIEGHCDERGTAEYNLALGEKRAMEAAKFLIGLGIAKDRIKTISYGEEMPLDKRHNEEAWAKNRRDHFVVFPPVK